MRVSSAGSCVAGPTILNSVQNLFDETYELEIKEGLEDIRYNTPMSNKSSQSVTCHDIEGNNYEVASSELSFRPAVYAIIIQDNKILLSKQWDGYDFPGGGIELGEGTEVALTREVKEETGIEIEVGRIVYANNSFFKLPYKEKFVHSIHFYYECSTVGGQLSTEFFDEQEQRYAEMPEWVELSEVGNIKVYSSVDAREVLEALD